MIGKYDEYERMYQAERQLWWYRILHQKVRSQIKEYFHNHVDISILDAGCGTGGLLSYLQEEGFEQLEGFDFSTDAVTFSTRRGLNVVQQDLTQLSEYKPKKQFDVIICNDVFTYFSDEIIVQILQAIRAKLKPNGLFISNNNAHAAFAGIHDLVVGGQKRFVAADLKRLAAAANLPITYSTYWSFLLALPILLVRAWQRFQLRRKMIDLENHPSDVALPPIWLDQTLYGLVKVEEKIGRRMPFGSSIFITTRI